MPPPSATRVIALAVFEQFLEGVGEVVPRDMEGCCVVGIAAGAGDGCASKQLLDEGRGDALGAMDDVVEAVVGQRQPATVER